MDKDTALQKLADAKNAGGLVFVNRDEIVVADNDQYATQIVEVVLDKDLDYHNISGSFQPNKQATQKIADANGISFLDGGTYNRGKFEDVKVITNEAGLFEAVGEFSVIGWAQGSKRLSDGTWRKSSKNEYEFSIPDRTNDLFWNEKTKPANWVAAKKKLLEMKKHATSRASTGAQLRVVRELASIPTAFKFNQMNKPMYFAQVVESKDYKHKIISGLMQKSDGRQALAAAVMGVEKKLTGNFVAENEDSNLNKLSESTIEQIPKPDEVIETLEPIEVDELEPLEQKTSEPDEATMLKKQLETWYISGLFDNNQSNKAIVKKRIEDTNVDVELLRSTVEYFNKQIAKAKQEGTI